MNESMEGRPEPAETDKIKAILDPLKDRLEELKSEGQPRTREWSQAFAQYKTALAACLSGKKIVFTGRSNTGILRSETANFEDTALSADTKHSYETQAAAVRQIFLDYDMTYNLMPILTLALVDEQGQETGEEIFADLHRIEWRLQEESDQSA